MFGVWGGDTIGPGGDADTPRPEPPPQVTQPTVRGSGHAMPSDRRSLPALGTSASSFAESLSRMPNQTRQTQWMTAMGC